MKITVLTDNKAKEGFGSEWGLSLHICHNGKQILLDTGSSPLFASNAGIAGTDISRIDLAFLSHAHYDHSNGFGEFFRLNTKASLYMNENCKEKCYGKRWIFSKYIGIKKGYLEAYSDRIIFTKGFTEIEKDIFLIPHSEKDFTSYGKKNGLFLRHNKKWCYDGFLHEQSLVLRDEKGLVIFNSCCHVGADNIISEVAALFPDERILALIGGFHLYKSDEKEILSLAERIRETGIEKIYTGHCTGDKAFALLKNQLGDKVNELCSGLEITI